MKRKENESLILIICFAALFFSIVAGGIILGSRYIDNQMLKSNEEKAMDLALVVEKNLTLTDAEVDYMKTLSFNEMEKDPINHRMTDVGTGMDLNAPTISIYLIAPLAGNEIKYYVDETNSDFFKVDVGTALDGIWLLNAAIAEDGNPIFAQRDDIYRYTHITEEIQQGLDEKTAFGAYSKDEWGEVISGYAPFYTEEGNFVGLLGIDMDLDDYQHDVHGMVLLLILLFTVITFTLFGLFIWFYSKYIKTQKVKMYSDFYSRISHDMRTPMNGIIGLSHLAETEDSPEVLHDYFHKVKESGDYLLNLINDTLDISKISSGKMELNLSPVKCRDIIQSVVDMIKINAEKNEITFEVINHDFELEDYIMIDAIRFKQILLNLLSNAVKFTPKGGKVRFTMECLGKDGLIFHNRFIIQDTGIGMSKVFVEKSMFTAFSQESNQMMPQIEGTGLGLSIVKYFVEKMGGGIKVESVEGEGSTFTIDVDFKQVDMPEEKRKKDDRVEETNISKESLIGKRILLCEDHPLNAEIAEKLLDKAGYIVETVENGEIGLSLFKMSVPGYYAAILMDIRMPVMDGITATKEIRKLNREDARDIPIIAMTANAYDEDMRIAKEAGIDVHMAKPINPDVLYKTLAERIQTFDAR
ncbi:MAG: ATP-binding protein [Lachnospiraceae bacterium]|nr:ATP-binding protein [Lachnospiraceae bacterium]